MHIRRYSAWLVAILVGGFGASPAFALRDRVFVASYGTDSGNSTCSFTQPCRTFQNAVNNVAVDGEVTAIDSAGFGPINITQSVTITSPAGVEAGITAASGNDGIDINAPGAVVKLRGLTLIGANSANNAVSVTAAARLEVIDCAISQFGNSGVVVESASAMSVLISNTVITDLAPGQFGVGLFNDDPGSGALAVIIDHLLVSSANAGVEVSANFGPIQLLMTDSRIDKAPLGVVGGGQPLNLPAQAVSIILQNVVLSQNSSAALFSFGGTSYWLSHVTQSSVTGFSDPAIVFQGTNNHAFSDGTNHLMGTGANLLSSSWTAN